MRRRGHHFSHPFPICKFQGLLKSRIGIVGLCHLAAGCCNLLHVCLALEPLLRRENRRGYPRAEFCGGNHRHGPAKGASDTFARGGGGGIAQRQREGDEASKVEDRVEPLETHRGQPVCHDHALLPHSYFEVDNRHDGYAGRKNEKLQRARACAVGYNGVPVVYYHGHGISILLSTGEKEIIGQSSGCINTYRMLPKSNWLRPKALEGHEGR